GLPYAASRRGGASRFSIAHPVHADVSADVAGDVWSQYRGSGIRPTGQNPTRIGPEAVVRSPTVLLTDHPWPRPRLGPHPQPALQLPIRQGLLGLSAHRPVDVRWRPRWGDTPTSCGVGAR